MVWPLPARIGMNHTIPHRTGCTDARGSCLRADVCWAFLTCSGYFLGLLYVTSKSVPHIGVAGLESKFDTRRRDFHPKLSRLHSDLLLRFLLMLVSFIPWFMLGWVRKSTIPRISVEVISVSFLCALYSTVGVQLQYWFLSCTCPCAVGVPSCFSLTLLGECIKWLRPARLLNTFALEVGRRRFLVCSRVLFRFHREML
jgi:hypothetical protein